jgi:hypothetical protein
MSRLTARARSRLKSARTLPKRPRTSNGVIGGLFEGFGRAGRRSGRQPGRPRWANTRLSALTQDTIPFPHNYDRARLPQNQWGPHMRPRKFIPGLGSGTVWPLAALGQAASLPTIGFLCLPSTFEWQPFVDAFRRGSEETGRVDGQNMPIEYRRAAGQFDRLLALAADDGREVVGQTQDGGRSRPPRARHWIVVGCLMLAGCATQLTDPPVESANPAHAECKVAYNQAFTAAQGNTEAAKRDYWRCLGEKGNMARTPPPMDRNTGTQ